MHLRDFLTFHGAEDLSRINSPLAGAAGGKGPRGKTGMEELPVPSAVIPPSGLSYAQAATRVAAKFSFLCFAKLSISCFAKFSFSFAKFSRNTKLKFGRNFREIFLQFREMLNI